MRLGQKVLDAVMMRVGQGSLLGVPGTGPAERGKIWTEK